MGGKTPASPVGGTETEGATIEDQRRLAIAIRLAGHGIGKKTIRIRKRHGHHSTMTFAGRRKKSAARNFAGGAVTKVQSADCQVMFEMSTGPWRKTIHFFVSGRNSMP